MDQTKAVRVSVEEELCNELIHEHLDEIEEHYLNRSETTYYTQITEERIREIIRDELKNIEMEKMYNE